MDTNIPQFIGINDLIRIDGLVTLAKTGNAYARKEVRRYKADAKLRGYPGIEEWIAASVERLGPSQRKVWDRAQQIAAMHRG